MLRVLVFLVLASIASSSTAEDCPQPGAVRYPMSEVLQSVAIRLEFNFDENGGLDFDSPIRERILGQLEGKSSAERDASLLALLQWHTKGTLPVFSITMYSAAPMFDTYLELLDRHELQEAADALRQARAAFAVWDTSIQARYNQWSDGRGTINSVLDRKLRAASNAFVRAGPAIDAKAEELAALDADFSERLQVMVAATPDETRFFYLADLVEACVAAQARDFDTVVAELPKPLQNALFVNRFILETGNGGSHQYFFNQSGDDAPQFLTALIDLGLEQQAQDFAAAMAVIATPYPTDTETRRAIIATLSEDQDEALYQPTWIMDTPDLYSAMDQVLKDNGYWPE